MRIAIHQPQYMPWLGYFHKMASVDLFVLLDDVQFKKNEWQHRNRIRNAQGWQWLSVPNAYKFPQTIREVAVKSQMDWETKHLRSLEMCYSRAPYYAGYSDAFREYYATVRKTMDEVTVDSVQLLGQLIGIRTPIEISSKYGFKDSSTQRLVNICRHFGADTYLAGAGGHEYMDLTIFEKTGIAVEFQQFQCPYYRQHWSSGPEDFIPDLSAIDLVFNCGRESLKVLLKDGGGGNRGRNLKYHHV